MRFSDFFERAFRRLHVMDDFPGRRRDVRVDDFPDVHVRDGGQQRCQCIPCLDGPRQRLRAPCVGREVCFEP